MTLVSVCFDGKLLSEVGMPKQLCPICTVFVDWPILEIPFRFKGIRARTDKFFPLYPAFDYTVKEREKGRIMHCTRTLIAYGELHGYTLDTTLPEIIDLAILHEIISSTAYS